MNTGTLYLDILSPTPDMDYKVFKKKKKMPWLSVLDGSVRMSRLSLQDGSVRMTWLSLQDGIVRMTWLSLQDGSVRMSRLSLQDGSVRMTWLSLQDGSVRMSWLSVQDGSVRMTWLSLQDGSVRMSWLSLVDRSVRMLWLSVQDGSVRMTWLSLQDPRAGPGVERIGRTPPPLSQSVETWPIGVRLVCRELRPVSLEERNLVIELVDMQHITSALISARRETMRARVWSVGFVAPSPRDNLSFGSSLIPTMFPFTFLSSEGGGSTGQSCSHLACASIS